MLKFSEIRAIAERLERAQSLLEAVEPIEGETDWFIVTGTTGKHYLVHDGRCSCPDWEFSRPQTQGWCKHRLATKLFKEAQEAAKGEEAADLERKISDLYH
jgi:predicted nucleic acid-binding Zn finger protein